MKNRTRAKAKIDRICGHLAVALDRHCVVCGSTQQLESGHYLSRVRDTTRFDMRNIYAQCKACNRLHENNAEPLRRAVLGWLSQEDFENLQALWWSSKQYKVDLLTTGAYLQEMLEIVLGVYSSDAKVDIWGPYSQTLDVVLNSKIPDSVWVRKMFKPETFILPDDTRLPK